MGVEQPGEQLGGGLALIELELLELLPGQHQPRFQLQEGRDQNQKLGRGLELELAARLQVVDVGDHHLCEVDLEQIDLLAQDQRQQEVERPREDLQVQLQVDQPQRIRLHRVETTRVAGLPRLTDRTDAHRLAHVCDRLGRDRPGLLGPDGEHLFEP